MKTKRIFRLLVIFLFLKAEGKSTYKYRLWIGYALFIFNCQYTVCSINEYNKGVAILNSKPRNFSEIHNNQPYSQITLKC